MIQEILKRFSRKVFTGEDFLFLLNVEDEQDFQPVFEYSEKICESVYGRDVFVRGILEFSNICTRNCFYCGLRKGNDRLKRYRMKPDEIFKEVRKVSEKGIRTIVLQSGEDDHFTDEIMASLLERIKKNFNMAITLSIGERSYESYKQLKEAGADRFLLRIETSDEKLFKRLHPDGNFQQRKKCLHFLKELGYELGTGIMVGLPGQSCSSLVKDIFFFKEVGADMIGIGPFLSHQDTPLRNFRPRKFFLTLKVLALIRCLLPDVNIPATTAMGTIDPQGRQKALAAGANVIMPNLSPAVYRPLYQLYDNKICVYETSANCLSCTEEIVRQAGKTVCLGRGDRIKQ
ncbi:MAG: [FeFe] hydrogenase H-cluster radical SAM maturase HydE [bacterium]|nr:[FeFe] hydrogenase H-cluster radical SAM maturase HydE [bacterium]